MRKTTDASRSKPARWRASGREKSHAFILRVRINTFADSGNRRIQFAVEDVSTRSTKRFPTFELASTWLSGRVSTILNQPTGIAAEH